MQHDNQLRVLYVVSIDAPTSVPLEAAGRIAALCFEKNIIFHTVAYYRQSDERLKTNFVSDLIELDFRNGLHLKNILSYYRLIKKYKPHIVHFHHGISAFEGALLAKLAGVKYIFKTEHNDHKFYKWYQKVSTIPLFLMSDRIICNSRSTKLSYYPWEKLIAGGKSTFIYNGINLAEISLANKSSGRQTITKTSFGIEKDDIVFVSVGRLIKQKNYRRLLLAMSCISRTHQKVKLIIVGGGIQEAMLRQVVKENNCEQTVFLTGSVSREEVYKYLDMANFFIIASLWEGFCNALVEAMAAGKPVLCSSIDTLREVAGDCAVTFFKPESVPSISSAIRKASSLSQNEINSFSAKGRQRAYENFTLEKTAELYVNEYIEIFNQYEA